MNAFESIECTIAFDVRDWSKDRRSAWIYAIVYGWDYENSWDEVAKKYGWDEEDRKRANMMHEQWIKAREMEEQEAVEPTFRQDENGVFAWACGSCGAYMYHIYDGIDKAKEYAKYCRQCGRKVKWEE